MNKKQNTERPTRKTKTAKCENAVRVERLVIAPLEDIELVVSAFFNF